MFGDKVMCPSIIFQTTVLIPASITCLVIILLWHKKFCLLTDGPAILLWTTPSRVSMNSDSGVLSTMEPYPLQAMTAKQEEGWPFRQDGG